MSALWGRSVMVQPCRGPLANVRTHGASSPTKQLRQDFVRLLSTPVTCGREQHRPPFAPRAAAEVIVNGHRSTHRRAVPVLKNGFAPTCNFLVNRAGERRSMTGGIALLSLLCSDAGGMRRRSRGFDFGLSAVPSGTTSGTALRDVHLPRRDPGTTSLSTTNPGAFIPGAAAPVTASSRHNHPWRLHRARPHWARAPRHHTGCAGSRQTRQPDQGVRRQPLQFRSSIGRWRCCHLDQQQPVGGR